MSRHDRAGLLCALASVLLVLLLGCGTRSGDVSVERSTANSGLARSAADVAMVAPELDVDSAHTPSVAMKGRLLTADLLVVAGRALPSRLVSRVNRARGVRLAVPMSLAAVLVDDSAITVAAVEPASFRRFAPEQTAKMDAVWRSVAAGDAILSHQLGRELRQTLGGTFRVGSERSEVPLRVGAYATTVSRIDVVVNDERREQLGMKPGNALLVSVDHAALGETLAAVRDVVGERARVESLGASRSTTKTRQPAYLTGGAVARAVGSFKYRAFPDGSVEPETGWVAANIRTEQVPIFGRVTCHRVMLWQLRAAMSEIVERGLADTIDAGDYGGCYVPRFIGRDPSKGLSLHTWGIAIDLNVAGNQRGTAGEIDRRVVAIFKRWGFSWGGDWQWTDPMHFELAALVRDGNRS